MELNGIYFAYLSHYFLYVYIYIVPAFLKAKNQNKANFAEKSTSVLSFF